MSETSLRKIKEVNGWKINHPHSAANIFYIIFTLLIVVAPLLFLFLPTLALNLINPETKQVIETSSFNGIDLVKMTIELFKYIINETGMQSDNALINAFLSPEFVGNNLQPMVPYFYLTLTGCLGLIIIFSIVLFIIFLVSLLKGYLKHSGVVKVFTGLNFFFACAYLSMALVIFFGFRGSDANRLGIYTVTWFWPVVVVGVYLVLLIVVSSIYSANFKDSIPEKELELHDDKPTVENVTKVHEVNVIKYEGSSTLPPNLKEIGGHAFAENQSLLVANIPIEISKLGASAFANCLKLKVVSIPNSITEIGSNCFFNCVSLERINYNGTKEEWSRIIRGSNWLSKAKTSEVVCLDGTITVNPYH